MNYQDRLKLMNQIKKELETINITDSSNSDVIKINTEEVYDVVTEEDYIKQLNRLYTKGDIDKEYYLKQVRLLKNTYSKIYSIIKEKLLIE